MIWIASTPMAWRQYWFRASQWMMFWLVSPVLRCADVQRATHASGFAWRPPVTVRRTEVPRKAELLLHWALGKRCRSLPGDLSEEYAWMLESGSSRKQADHWYDGRSFIRLRRSRRGASNRQWRVYSDIACLAAVVDKRFLLCSIEIDQGVGFYAARQRLSLLCGLGGGAAWCMRSVMISLAFSSTS